MKKISLLFALITCSLLSHGQDMEIKKLRKQLKEHSKADTFRVNRLNELAQLPSITTGQLDTIGTEALLISRKLGYHEGEVYALLALAQVKFQRADLPQATAMQQQALALAEKITDKTYLVNAYLSVTRSQMFVGESKAALALRFKAEALAQATQNKRLIARCQLAISGQYQNSVGNFAKAMEWVLKAEKNAEEVNDLGLLASVWSGLAGIYTIIGDQERSLVYYKKALEANQKLGNRSLEFSLLNRIGERYRLTGKYHEAIKAYVDGIAITEIPYNIELSESNVADVYVRLNDLPMAFKYAFKSLYGAKKIDDVEGEEWIEGILGRAYIKQNMPDSAIYYANIGYNQAIHTGTIEFKRDNCEALSNAFALKKDFGNAYKYHVLYTSYRDSMMNAQVSNQANVLEYNYDMAKKQAQITTLNQERKLQNSLLLGALAVLGLIGITVVILVRNNRQKQKANNLLSEQKKIIEDQRDQTNKALGDLQLTQKQLIQSEKMASLGELTAGIAHEIQNPLNFVNNFSEVNADMLDDLEVELKAGNVNEALAIASDIKLNEQKINHHGKRADFIVKGMLQHSRTSTGEKQRTNINVLADEFFKIAYHGLRAKDKAFNAELTTDFDPNLPKVNVVPQDMGRVMLNLFNNAFYAVNQRQKTAGTGYKPEVTVSTASENGHVIIKVKDNGNGISDAIKEKIMQPFFTTKPTGEGTGLGLSLTYDMVVKGHDGTIDVNSAEGSGSEFIVKLPY